MENDGTDRSVLAVSPQMTWSPKRQLRIAKVRVAGSSPVVRSNIRPGQRRS